MVRVGLRGDTGMVRSFCGSNHFMICGGVYILRRMYLVCVKEYCCYMYWPACQIHSTTPSGSRTGDEHISTHLISALLVSLDIIHTDIIAIPRKSQSDSFPTIHQIWSAQLILPNAFAFSIACSRTSLLPNQ